MSNSREFIDNIADNDNLEAETHFTNIMIDKVGSSLEDRRYDLSNDLVNEKNLAEIVFRRPVAKPKPTLHHSIRGKDGKRLVAQAGEAGPEMQRAAMQVGRQASGRTPQAKMQQDRAAADMADTNVKMAKTVKKYVASDPKLSRSKGMGNIANKAVKANVQARERMASKKGPGAGAILRGRKTSERMGTDRSGYGSKSELDIGSQTALQRQVTKNRNLAKAKAARADRSGGDDDFGG